MHLDERELHTWCGRLTDLFTDESCLSAEELERAARFRFEPHRKRFLAAHSCVRYVLSGYTGCRPEELEFTSTGRGKPELLGGPLQFNFSHTDDFLMLAIALGSPVGIDVETARENTDLLRIARRFFSEGEYEALAATSGSAQVECFYRLWTLKEAYVKATGEGLQAITQRFDFTQGLSGLPFEFDGWRLHRLDAPEGCLAAVACREPMTIRQFDM